MAVVKRIMSGLKIMTLVGCGTALAYVMAHHISNELVATGIGGVNAMIYFSGALLALLVLAYLLGTMADFYHRCLNPEEIYQSFDHGD